MQVNPAQTHESTRSPPANWRKRTLLELAGGLKELFDDGDWIESQHITTVGIRLIQTGNIGIGSYVEKEAKKYIYEASFKSLRCKPLVQGDLLICRLADPAGRACVLPDIGELTVVTSVDVTIFRPPPEDVDRVFLCNVFSTPSWFRVVSDHSGGTTHKRISRGALGRIAIALPPIEEQRAIAEALSDVDALLNGLDRLIAKKRDIKQAAMQQLLTGQTRLPGFQGEWEVKRLGEIFQIAVGTSKSSFITENGEYWICDMGSVSATGKLIVSKRTNYRGDFLKAGDLIMPKDDIGGGNIIGKVGYIDADETYVLSDHVYHLRAMAGYPQFLAYAINSHRTNRELRKKVIGSAQLGLGRKSVTEQEIRFPTVSEQTAIATVLSDMDAELAALEARRDKTRLLKQGMMQELLTGKTRLVKPEAAHV